MPSGRDVEQDQEESQVGATPDCEGVPECGSDSKE